MRNVVGLLLAAAVGIHCSSPPESSETSAPELTQSTPPSSPAPRPGAEPSASFRGGPSAAEPLEQKTPDLTHLLHDTDNTRVTSTVVDSVTGATYATGTFVRDVLVGGTLIENRGDKDVFLLKVDARGALEWVRAVGSAYADSEPRVKLEGTEVNVIGMTAGAMDCGAGPLPTWSSSTFFFCVFGSLDGASVSGGVFPTGTP